MNLDAGYLYIPCYHTPSVKTLVLSNRPTQTRSNRTRVCSHIGAYDNGPDLKTYTYEMHEFRWKVSLHTLLPHPKCQDTGPVESTNPNKVKPHTRVFKHRRLSQHVHVQNSSI